MKNFFFLLLLFFIPTSSSMPSALVNDDWTAGIFFAPAEVNILNEPSDDAASTGLIKAQEQCLAVINKDDEENLGWLRIIYPVKGYARKESLSKSVQGGKAATWNWKIKYCNKDYILVKEEPDFQTRTTAILEYEEKVVVIIDYLNNDKIWSKIIYPVEGFVQSEELINSIGGFALGIGGMFGLKEIPYEKNFDNYKHPFGGFIDLFQTSWKLNLRLGYTYNESNISTYFLKTHLAYSQVSYNFVSLMNGHLNPYIFAGLGYWSSSFQNTKYGTENEYYSKEKDSGLCYLTGGGFLVNYFNFYLDVQYSFWGSGLAEFGHEPAFGEFSNLYKVYPGSNQLNVMLGYKFIF